MAEIALDARRPLTARLLIRGLKGGWPEDYLTSDEHGLSGRISEALSAGLLRMVDPAEVRVSVDESDQLEFRQDSEEGSTGSLYAPGPTFFALFPERRSSTEAAP